MSHVDEGALHAYLDGALDEYPPAEAARIRAHLDGCAACAERLEAERRIRTEAHGILAMAAPEVEPPSFEELRAYVERTRTTGGGASTRGIRMRWAASVVLALGTGWLLRGGIPGPGANALLEAPSARQSELAATAEGQPVERAGSAPGQGAAADGETVDVAAASRERVSSPDASATVEALVADRDARPVAQVAAEPGPAEDDFASDAAATAPSAGIGAAAPTTALAGTGAAADPAEELRVEPPSEPALPAARTAELANRSAAAPAVRALAPVATTADAAGTADEPTRSTARRDAPVVSAMERGAAAPLGAAVLEEEAEDVPATVSLTVPGYDVVSITNLGQGTSYQGVHIVQRLEDGATFEIYHLEPEVERSVVPLPADGLGEVARRSEDGWIVLQGPLSRSELETLVGALFPPGEPEGG